MHLMNGKMVDDMELQEAKDKVLQLMKDKDKIESELKALKEILDANRVGMDENLVDSEGYPRQDIDVFQVRHARHKIICLRNDHTALMNKIEEGLHKVHALAGNERSVAAATSSIQDSLQLEPFLRVNLVTHGSPAELAGIQVEDLILKFGGIDYRNFKSLKDIGSLVTSSENMPIEIKVKRGSNIVSLTLVPHRWSGNGLLGCNVMSIETVER
ncbi:26S proteasome non-ATPase regulatory subunit 9 [Hylaeus anthracinus]|uniref:26S proteasome non-ATPase regulatory subunit 9 n=1 Tax=Hylaeus anthracinus TaxID=313031 RepID=UPI0023B93FC0|nr:26S proteasome non-ATPase regulatory subunit 9 [Hylaeus anthracinus]